MTDAEARRGLRLDIGEEGATTTRRPRPAGGGNVVPGPGIYRHPDGSEVQVVVDEHGERFAGVRYHDRDDDDEEEMVVDDDHRRRRSLSHAIDHLIVKINPNHSNPAEKCEALAGSIYGTVVTVFDGDAFTGCEIAPSEMATMSEGDAPRCRTRAACGPWRRTGSWRRIRRASIRYGTWTGWISAPFPRWEIRQGGRVGGQAVRHGHGIRSDHEEFVGMIDPNSPCHFFRSRFSDDAPVRRQRSRHPRGQDRVRSSLRRRPHCELCAVKVLNSAGFGSWTGMIAGLNHIVSYCTANADKRCVANLSLGAAQRHNERRGGGRRWRRGSPLSRRRGHLLKNACLSSPASATTSISVGSTTIDDGMSSFSNYGSCVDVYAPGTNILSASNGNTFMYSSKMGTSMACPHVSAIASGWLTSHPGLTPLPGLERDRSARYLRRPQHAARHVHHRRKMRHQRADEYADDVAHVAAHEAAHEAADRAPDFPSHARVRPQEQVSRPDENALYRRQSRGSFIPVLQRQMFRPLQPRQVILQVKNENGGEEAYCITERGESRSPTEMDRRLDLKEVEQVDNKTSSEYRSSSNAVFRT
ncbi:LOW QUALITY PROTEIN: hypothetical protein ACHAW5_005039 [Stephanodiscus triporus]|uniref:subtilisin n=1 Tax=Stephanodiscus triporus TaxID=2934178 RepID=A0ABD3R3M2_9STRA